MQKIKLSETEKEELEKAKKALFDNGVPLPPERSFYVGYIFGLLSRITE